MWVWSRILSSISGDIRIDQGSSSPGIPSTFLSQQKPIVWTVWEPALLAVGDESSGLVPLWSAHAKLCLILVLLPQGNLRNIVWEPLIWFNPSCLYISLDNILSPVWMCLSTFLSSCRPFFWKVFFLLYQNLAPYNHYSSHGWFT